MNKNPIKLCDFNHLDIQKATNDHMNKNSPDKCIVREGMGNEDNGDENALKKRKKRNRKKKKKTEEQSISITNNDNDKDKDKDKSTNKIISEHDNTISNDNCNLIDKVDDLNSDIIDIDINLDIDIDINHSGMKLHRNDLKTNLLNNIISIKTMDTVKLPEHRGFSEESIQ